MLNSLPSDAFLNVKSCSDAEGNTSKQFILTVLSPEVRKTKADMQPSAVMSCGLMNPKLISVADPFQMITLESETFTAILERTDVKCSVNQLAACGT